MLSKFYNAIKGIVREQNDQIKCLLDNIIFRLIKVQERTGTSRVQLNCSKKFKTEKLLGDDYNRGIT